MLFAQGIKGTHLVMAKSQHSAPKKLQSSINWVMKVARALPRMWVTRNNMASISVHYHISQSNSCATLLEG